MPIVPDCLPTAPLYQPVPSLSPTTPCTELHCSLYSTRVHSTDPASMASDLPV